MTGHDTVVVTRADTSLATPFGWHCVCGENSEHGYATRPDAERAARGHEDDDVADPRLAARIERLDRAPVRRKER